MVHGKVLIFMRANTGPTLKHFLQTSSPNIYAIICQSLNMFCKLIYPNFVGAVSRFLLPSPQSIACSFPIFQWGPSGTLVPPKRFITGNPALEEKAPKLLLISIQQG